MLSARKDNIEKDVALQIVALQQQELSFYYNNNDSLATVGTLVFGFSYASLDDEYFKSENFREWNYIYHICCICAIVFNVAVVVLSVFANIHGQGLALHGPPGSLKRAVRGMYYCQQVLMLLFSLSMFFFMAQVVVYSVMLDLNGSDRHIRPRGFVMIGMAGVGVLGMMWGVVKITSLFAIDGEKTETAITTETSTAIGRHFVAAPDTPNGANTERLLDGGEPGDDQKPAASTSREPQAQMNARQTSITFSEGAASEHASRFGVPRQRKGFRSAMASIFGGYDPESVTANRIQRERDAVVARFSEHGANVSF